MANEVSKSIEERTKELQQDPGTMSIIYKHVANGGSLIDLCKTWDVNYCDMSEWVNDDKSRSDKYQAALQARNEWAKEAVLLEFRRIGLADIRKLYDEEGELLPVKEWPDEVASFVANIEVNELFEGSGKDREHVGYVKKVKLWNKEKSLELLGKNMSMFFENHKLSGNLTLEDIINKSREDVE